jgi:formylmethanofuran:tetrahydromethanopterin formyltransferase
MLYCRSVLCLVVGASVASLSGAFQPCAITHLTVNRQHHERLKPLEQAADAWTGNNNAASRVTSGGGFGAVEQIEFKIYPDGRVEEIVRGVKGNDCHKVTEQINAQLGKVIQTQPTEEMFEQEVEVKQTLYQSDVSGDWEGSSTW